MLVLSRRIGESIVIGDDVTVTVLEVRGDVVRVGIDAPRSVAVHRAELLEQIGESNRDAASPADSAVDQLKGALLGRRGGLDLPRADRPGRGGDAGPSSQP
ncbi:carbon storage regulator CsrA [Nocardioidaceae bacterium]|nr:carbon storage regulator CsrA [Nocardioidaceae bacterium]